MAKRSPAAIPDRLKEALDNHPEKIQIDFGGHRDFLLCAYGAKILRGKGHDPIPVVFDALRTLAPVLGQFAGTNAKPHELMAALFQSLDPKLVEDMCLVIWWGLIPYDDKITLDEVEVHATPRAIFAVIEQVYEQMSSFGGDEEIAKVKAAVDGDSGN